MSGYKADENDCQSAGKDDKVERKSPTQKIIETSNRSIRQEGSTLTQRHAKDAVEGPDEEKQHDNTKNIAANTGIASRATVNGSSTETMNYNEAGGAKDLDTAGKGKERNGTSSPDRKEEKQQKHVTKQRCAINVASHDEDKNNNYTNNNTNDDDQKDMKFFDTKPADYEPGLWVLAASVGTWTYVGVLTRVGLSNLEEVILKVAADANSMQDIGFGSGYWFANVFGTVMLGVLISLCSRHKWLSTGPVFAVNKVGFGTGFCGSCTTFSTWNFHSAQGYFEGNACSSVFNLLVGAAVWCSCYRLGLHLPCLFHGLTHTSASSQTSKLKAVAQQQSASLEDETYDIGVLDLPGCPVALSKDALERCWFAAFGITSALFWILTLTYAPITCNELYLDVVLSPAGSLLRWYLGIFNKKPTMYPCRGRQLSPSSPSQRDLDLRERRLLCNVQKWNFPAYTFIANMMGATVTVEKNYKIKFSSSLPHFFTVVSFYTV
mmetsp:Transcript_14483/g.20239  ORF Transcript_14483/g.20239 Transcript_14483/m.20239 type:complete len:492 (+) Transcript_14483:99-1574(+)